MNLYEEISKVAYELYEKGGRVGGRDVQNWLEAEKIVMARSVSKDINQTGVGIAGSIKARTVNEKRKHKRFTLKGSQKNFLHSVNSRIINISAGGVAVETTKKLEVNKAYSLNISFKGNPLRLKCRAVWSALSREERKESGDTVRIYTGGLKFHKSLSANTLSQH